MKYSFTCLCLTQFFIWFVAGNIYSQEVPPPDTSKYLPRTNAGFDVIIKRNGDILYGLVKEVSQDQIKYQRTDIPDGPIYTVQRSEVYAISYRNQVKDILNPLKDTTAAVKRDTVRTSPDTAVTATPPVYRPSSTPASMQKAFFKDGNIRLGIGFIRSYTGVKQASQYSSSATFPIISIGYDVRYKDPIRLGVQLAFGPHKFSRQEYSSYDSTQSNVKLKERIFTLHVYSKYSFANYLSLFQPYVLLGLGLHTSRINSTYDISFINNGNKVQVNSGSNAVSLGILARIGTDFLINDKLRIFGDVGFGASVINIGVSTNVY